MGMFDYVRCQYPLPKGAPTGLYQSKCTPPQGGQVLTITEDGRMVDELGDLVPVRGVVYFYTYEGTNVEAWWEFSALFDDGRLINLRTERTPATKGGT